MQVWDDHDDYPVADWKTEVADGDTRLGYEVWRLNKIILSHEAAKS